MEDDNDAYDNMHYESRNKPLRSKYEIPRRTLADQQKEKRAKIFQAIANDDVKCTPFQLTHSLRKHRTLGSLCDEIARLQAGTNKSKATPRVKVVSRIYKWPSGQEVFEPSELLDDDGTDTIVYSDRVPLKRVSIESVLEGGGMGGRKSDNSRRSQKTSPTLRSSNGSMHAMNSPINIKVTSNTNRRSNCSVFINPRTTQDFQAILDNITEMLEMENPCIALYPVRQLKTKVDSMSRFKSLNPRHAEEFIACGSEGPPVQEGSQSPGRNRKAKNGMTNGSVRQSTSNNNYRDQKGRSYQRHNGERRSQTDEDDHSPTGHSPRRGGDTQRDESPRRGGGDTHRGNDQRERHGPYGKEKANARQPEQHNGHAGHNDSSHDDDDDMYGGRSNGNDDNESHDNRSVSSRGNSPTGSVMNKRIADMEETRSNLDKDVEY